MGRVLKPSVEAISVSQTCCFPTEPTCQSGDLQPHGKHTHTTTRPRSNTLAHTNIKEDILLGAAKHASTCIYTETCQYAKAQTKQILAQTQKRKQEFILFTRPRERTNTWLARRFMPVWKDKHQPINKSISLETC